MRTSLPTAAAIAAALAIAGCSSGGSEPAEDAGTAPSSTSAAAAPAQTSVTFGTDPASGITYDEQLVPAGATATVSSTEEGGNTVVTLEVTGLQPNRDYGAHAHAMACGAEGAAAGPHYQLERDPVSPSVDPAYANPQNEVWLDFTTDAEGAATATATVPWTFPADRRAQSVIIHAMPTKTGPGEAGTAGDRAACIPVQF